VQSALNTNLDIHYSREVFESMFARNAFGLIWVLAYLAAIACLLTVRFSTTNNGDVAQEFNSYNACVKHYGMSYHHFCLVRVPQQKSNPKHILLLDLNPPKSWATVTP
jgi:hypothetical protein